MDGHHPMIYLAEPIDRKTGDPSETEPEIALQFRWLSDELGGKYNVYRPTDAWSTSLGRVDSRIEQVNTHALRSADILVAYLPAHIPTIGVPMEINLALMLGIPAVVLTDMQPGFSLTRDGVTTTDWAYKAMTQIGTLSQNPPRRGADKDQVKITLAGPDGIEQMRPAYPDDAGIDLVCAETLTVGPGCYSEIKTTVTGVQLPAWSWGLVIGRSSAMSKHGLLVVPSVIDAGWRGPLLVRFLNTNSRTVTVQVEQRIGQLVIMDNATARCDLVRADRLDPHDRGINGFGSTGV